MSESLKIEQRANVKFCFKLGKTATETFEQIKTVYGDEAMSRSQVFQWFARFRDGQEEITDNARPGRPATSRNPEMVAKVDELLKSDRQLTLRKMEEKLGINKETIRIILEQDLGKRKVSVESDPKAGSSA